jgi:hypothetical protein
MVKTEFPTRRGLEAVDGSAKTEAGGMDVFVDRGLSIEEKAQVDSVLLRYTHSNIRQ